MRDDDIDRAIDEVARELTAGEPEGAFSARVVARIDAGEPRDRWFPRSMMSPLPVAALILVAIAAARWYVREHHAGTVVRVEVSTAPQQARSPETLALQSPEERAPPSPERSAGILIARRSSVRLKADATYRSANAPYGSDVDALAPPRLKIPSIALAPIDRGDSIQLQQLEPIAPIDVVPLSITRSNLEP